MNSKFVLTAIKARKPVVELKFDNYGEFRSQKYNYIREGYSVAAYVETQEPEGIYFEDISVQY